MRHKPQMSLTCIRNSVIAGVMCWILLIGGCMLIWSDDALIIDGKDRDIDYFIVEYDPNGFYMEAGKWVERAKNIDVNYNPATGLTGKTSDVPTINTESTQIDKVRVGE